MKHVEDVTANAGGERHTERRAGKQFRQVLPLHVLHLNVEEAILVAVAEDAGDPVIQAAQSRLQNRSAAFGFDNLLAVGVGTLVD